MTMVVSWHMEGIMFLASVLFSHTYPKSCSCAADDIFFYNLGEKEQSIQQNNGCVCNWLMITFAVFILALSSTTMLIMDIYGIHASIASFPTLLPIGM